MRLSVPSFAVGRPARVRDLLREICFPRLHAWYAIHLVVMLVGLRYWIDSVRTEPYVSWQIRALFRPEGDTQYVGLVSQVARGLLGESNFKDSFGTGLQAFPFGSMALHVLCVALFGARGFALGDALAFFGGFAAWMLLLRVAGAPDWLSRVVVLLLLSTIGLERWTDFTTWNVVPNLPATLGGLRLPRPLVTEPLCIATLAMGLTWLQPHTFGRSRLRAIGLGCGLAWVLQGDLHSAVGLGLALAVFVAVELVRSGFERAALENAAMVAAAATVALLPFALQQLLMHPDIPARMGMFRVSRLHPPDQYKEFWPRLRAVLLLLGGATLFGFALQRGAARRGTLACLLGLAATAFAFDLAMPAFAFVTGKSIQLYHFPDRFERVTTWCLVVGATLVVGWLVRRPLLRCLRWTGRPFGIAMLAETVLALALAGYVGSDSWKRNQEIQQGPPRGESDLGGNYKRDLLALTRELESPRYAKFDVLGTLDHVTGVWWTAFHHKFLVAGDPFPSTRSDAEEERRLLHLLHLMGLPSDRFESVIRNLHVNCLWFSGAKYQISPLHSFAPPDQYSATDRHTLRRGDKLASWVIRVPSGEVERLSRLYADEQRAPWTYADADLLVLTRLDPGVGYAPDPSNFEQVYSNATFTVWRRRGKTT